MLKLKEDPMPNDMPSSTDQNIFSIHFALILFPIIFFIVVQQFLSSYNKGVDGTYTQKGKKSRADIPEFHYFTVINTQLQTLVTQNVYSEEKGKKH